MRLAQLYATHGRLLRALAEASSDDHEAKRAWRDFLEPVVADWRETDGPSSVLPSGPGPRFGRALRA